MLFLKTKSETNQTDEQIQQFQKRFKKIPKILELDHLTVTGDVYFGRNVTLRGTVIGKSMSFIKTKDACSVVNFISCCQ